MRPRCVALALPLSLVLLCAGAPGPAAAAGAAVIGHGSRAAPVVALTFDDGGSAGAASILATLVASGVPGTYFPTANALLTSPGIWQRIATAGYPIGNHTASHAQLTALSDAAMAFEIARATTIIRNVTGRAPIACLRPPYGSFDARVAAIAAANGYPVLLLWDVDPKDWSGISAATIVDRVMRTVRNGSIILLHTGAAHTPEALPALIAALRARGFSFATVPQLIGGGSVPTTPGSGNRPPAPAPAPPPPPPPKPKLEVMTPPRRPTPSHPLGHALLVVRAPHWSWPSLMRPMV